MEKKSLQQTLPALHLMHEYARKKFNLKSYEKIYKH